MNVIALRPCGVGEWKVHPIAPVQQRLHCWVVWGMNPTLQGETWSHKVITDTTVTFPKGKCSRSSAKWVIPCGHVHICIPCSSLWVCQLAVHFQYSLVGPNNFLIHSTICTIYIYDNESCIVIALSFYLSPIFSSSELSRVGSKPSLTVLTVLVSTETS